eukprot:6915506-Pyramimonas_sp.AAC.1
MIEYRARLWGGFWSMSGEEILRLGDAMSDLRAAAIEHVKDLPPITAPCIQACSFFSATTAVGVDGWGPRA